MNKRYFLRAYLALLVFIPTLILLMLLSTGLQQLGFLPISESKFLPMDMAKLIFLQAFCFLVAAYAYQKIVQHEVFPLSDSTLRIRDIFLAIAGWLLTIVIIYWINKLLNIEVNQFDAIPKENFKQEPFVFFFLTVLVAPLYEEFIFRGVLLSALKGETILSKIIAVIVVSILFALIHQEKDVLLSVFLLSVYLCSLALWRQSVALPILIHAVQNFFTVIGILYGKSLPA
ncbi:MAG: CPBP family intramembrane metalloprotease [Candidatus Hydrogenedentota bacterium]|nr:MAG: CPBP family intramembrane metalloprotease [Candidatus Hydrogenedentota bacterium]